MDFKLGLMGIPGFMQQEVSDSQTPDADRNAVTNKTSSPSRSAGSNKQCSRPSLELDSSDDFRVPATKMARTESFSSKHSTPGHVTPCSPSDSTSAASDEAASIRSVLTSPTDSSGAHSHSQQRMMMMHHYQQQQRNCNADASAVNIALPPPPQFLNNPFLKQQQQQQQQMMIQIAQQQQQQQQQQQYHHHQPETFQFKQAADMGLHEAVFGPRYPFTSTQWAELEHQALVFKCMMARAPIPPELVAPILKSVAASNMCLQHHQNGWSQTSAATHHLDVEPGRCRRTDGKKWRCARPIVPDQKYCERHMHRGRNRKRGTAATTTSSTTTAAATTPSPMMLAAQKQQQQQQQQQHSLLQMNQRTTALQNHVLPQHQHHQQQQQQHQHQHQHFGRGYGTINTSGHMVVTAPSSSSSASSSMFHTAASYAGAGAGSLDSRITAFDLRPEQLLVSGRGQGEPASTKEDFPYARFFLHSDAEEEANFLQQQQQQQYLDLATATAYKKPDANASLRQLFVEGAGDGAASTLTSWSDQSSTHLSISMAGGSEFPNALQSHSHSLKLSMNNNNCSSSKQQWRGQLAESFQSSSSSNKGLGFETNTKSPLHKPTLGCFSEISSSSSAANSGVKPDNLLLS